MANDIDEYSKVSETSISTIMNGNGIETPPSVVIPSSISVANAVSKIDASVAAQNAQNHYTTVVKKVRNTSMNASHAPHMENGNISPPLSMSTLTTTSAAMLPVPMNGTSNAINTHISNHNHHHNHNHNHNLHHLHHHQSNYSGSPDIFFLFCLFVHFCLILCRNNNSHKLYIFFLKRIFDTLACHSMILFELYY